TTNLRQLCSGPGKLTQALAITLDLSGTRLGQTLSLRPAATPPNSTLIAAGPRVGISKAIDHPWRFYLKDNPFVSGKRL
ncbi:MAG: DNA-3-methyladenine glycosylase, partial [Candidatus Saccharibacteria bacterium]|nr:DNA-3-methyladenine glycosylase [Candidatus Saccharibacteria bacterium]